MASTEEDWSKKYSVLKRKCDDMEQVNENLHWKLRKIRKMILDAETEKLFLMKRLHRYEPETTPTSSKSSTSSKAQSISSQQNQPHPLTHTPPSTKKLPPPPPLVHVPFPDKIPFIKKPKEGAERRKAKPVQRKDVIRIKTELTDTNK